MNCQEVMEYMQRQLDLDLSRSEQDLLDRHMESCSTCRTMMQRLQRLTSELSSLPKVHPPVSLVDAIMPRLAEIDQARKTASVVSLPIQHDEHKQRTAQQTRRGRFTNMILGGVVAAGVLIGVGILSLDRDEQLQVADSSSGMMNQEAGEVKSLNLVFGMAAADDSIASDALSEDAGQAFGIQSIPEMDAADGMSVYPVLDERTGDPAAESVAPERGITDKGKSGPEPDVDSRSEYSSTDTDHPEESGFAFEMDDMLEHYGAASAYDSPSGEYSAYIENSSVIILGKDSEKLYTSLAFPDAEIYDLVWEQEDRLTFQIKTSETTYAYYIDLVERTEGKL